MSEAEERRKAEKAGDMLSTLLENFQDLELDPDYAAYLLLSAGLSMAVMNNRTSPVVVTQLLASAMMITNKNVLEEEGDDEDETVH